MKMEKIFAVVITLVLVSATFTVMAGPPPPPGGSTSGPIDSGVITLLIGAATYGYKKLKEREVANSENE